jgi:hypothetical protein
MLKSTDFGRRHVDRNVLCLKRSVPRDMTPHRPRQRFTTIVLAATVAFSACSNSSNDRPSQSPKINPEASPITEPSSRPSALPPYDIIKREEVPINKLVYRLRLDFIDGNRLPTGVISSVRAFTRQFCLVAQGSGRKFSHQRREVQPASPGKRWSRRHSEGSRVDSEWSGHRPCSSACRTVSGVV